MGFRPSLPDSLPVIGRSAANPRIVHAFGHGHHGLTQAAATAEIVAALIADRPPPTDPAPYSPARFR
jgi:D-amino-acid dehydrogenase